MADVFQDATEARLLYRHAEMCARQADNALPRDICKSSAGCGHSTRNHAIRREKIQLAFHDPIVRRKMQHVRVRMRACVCVCDQYPDAGCELDLPGCFLGPARSLTTDGRAESCP